MEPPKESSIFPPHPYYIPGYEGYVPQFNYQFGETYGKTTYRLLTDPGVRKSPRSVLAPLHKQKFMEDFSETKHGVQAYLPGRPGYFPYVQAEAAASLPDPVIEPKPLPAVPGLEEAEMIRMHMDPQPQDHPGEYVPWTRLPRGYPRRVPCQPVSEGQEWQLPEITPARRCRALEGSKQFEGMTLPGVADTAEQDYRLPRLDIPRVIQEKVIPGYTGFIPRFTWIYGVRYIQGVKDAMDEFGQHQFLQRNPVCSFGKRLPQTYWPNYRIYTSAGLIPSYTGFVPDLRHTYALTYGNGTRKVYQKQQKRRARAL
ncbi:PREDICTED: protein FAM166A [Calidris pugnax]|uniref:protein FAM166A n=1 Tax=Calidris pugnax TaxID=198806 RepID=UPI00071E21AF|nr:PREDICTED: protein FAM166A [Calidris pugnax]